MIDENLQPSLKALSYDRRTADRSVKQGVREIGGEVGARVEIIGVGTTGSGRYMIADYVGADIVKTDYCSGNSRCDSLTGMLIRYLR